MIVIEIELGVKERLDRRIDSPEQIGTTERIGKIGMRDRIGEIDLEIGTIDRIGIEEETLT